VFFKLLLACDVSSRSDSSDAFDLMYDYNNTDSLNLYLNSVSWCDVFATSNNVNECWNSLTSVLDYGISLFTPVKRVHTSRKSIKKYPFYIRQLLRKKSSMWRRFKRFRRAQLRSKYSVIKQKCSALIREFIKQKEERIINSNTWCLKLSLL